MFISIMIVIIVLSDFYSLLYAKERLQWNDLIVMTKNTEIQVNDSLRTIFRLLLAIGIFVFFIYGLFFIPFLQTTIILNLVVSAISIILLVKFIKRGDLFLTFNKRLWVIRIDAILCLIIWMPHFLPLLALVF